MPLLSRDAPGAGLPPQGYLFYQPQCNWTSTFGFGFWDTVNAIREMRLKNPRFADQWTTDRNAIADELDFFTCVRLHHDPRWCSPEGQEKTLEWQTWQPPSPPSLPPKSAGAAAVDRIENFTAGVGVVLDWLGTSLEPVSPELAEKRAAVCAGCPKNVDPDWIQKLESWAAESVRSLVGLKNDLKLSTSVDDKLNSCAACDCSLPLKVHVKIEHVKAHTSDRQKAALDPKCWILSEWNQ